MNRTHSPQTSPSNFREGFDTLAEAIPKMVQAALIVIGLLHDGPVPPEKVRAVADESGISWRTVERGKQWLARIGMPVQSRPAGFQGVRYWEWAADPATVRTDSAGGPGGESCRSDETPPPLQLLPTTTFQSAGMENEELPVGPNGVLGLDGWRPLASPSEAMSEAALLEAEIRGWWPRFTGLTAPDDLRAGKIVRALVDDLGPQRARLFARGVFLNLVDGGMHRLYDGLELLAWEHFSRPFRRDEARMEIPIALAVVEMCR